MNESEKLLRELIKEHGRIKTRILLSEMLEILNTTFQKTEAKASIIKAM
jgi:hypothetical protein